MRFQGLGSRVGNSAVNKMLPKARRLIRFGLFEVDLSAGVLEREGRKVSLQEQPFQVLTLLLERPGEVVTREEVRQKLWPQDTFVDYDAGLNTAIRKLREALGDSADNPRFVETLPRRGYRFIAPVDAAVQDIAPAVTEPPRFRLKLSQFARSAARHQVEARRK